MAQGGMATGTKSTGTCSAYTNPPDAESGQEATDRTPACLPGVPLSLRAPSVAWWAWSSAGKIKLDSVMNQGEVTQLFSSESF